MLHSKGRQSSIRKRSVGATCTKLSAVKAITCPDASEWLKQGRWEKQGIVTWAIADLFRPPHCFAMTELKSGKDEKGADLDIAEVAALDRPAHDRPSFLTIVLPRCAQDDEFEEFPVESEL
jgi:hypothetical protein